MSLSITFSASAGNGSATVTRGVVNNYGYAIRVGVRNIDTNVVFDDNVLIAANSTWSVRSTTETGLSNGTTYTYRMTILRNSTGAAMPESPQFTTATPRAPVSISVTAPNGAVGRAYSGSVSASGGTINNINIAGPSANVAFPGVSGGPVTSSPLIFSGTPTQTGTFFVDAVASNTSGSFAETTFSVSIGNPPTLSGFIPSSGTVSSNFGSWSLTASGSTSTLSVVSGSLPPGLSPSGASTTNWTISGTPTTAGTYSFTVRASNSFADTDLGFTIRVSAPANPGWDEQSLANGKVSNFYSDTLTANGNTTSLSGVSIAPTGQGIGVSVDGRVVTVSGTPTAAGTYTVYATANGASGTTASSISPSFTINPLVPPSWTDNTLSNTFTVGTAYSDSVSATGATSYSVSAGSLPSGILLNSSTGAVTGTPTAKQNYNFTISANNSDGSVTASFSGTTSAPPIWIDQTLATFVAGVAYSDGVSATSLTTPGTTYSVTAGALPTGINLNASTGAVTGTPVAGNYSFTIRASNPDGNVSASFSGRVLTPPVWTKNTLSSFQAGVPYSDFVQATNSPTYTLHSGSLPTGLTFSNGTISGTPTTLGQAYNFTIRATNADGFVSQAFSGTVAEEEGGKLKLYDNGSWSDKVVYVYSGTAWTEGRVYIFDGSTWQKSKR